MISIDQYVPILKAKRGEFKALAVLPLPVLNKIVPVFDLVQPQDLFLFQKKGRSIEEYRNYLEKYFTKIISYIEKYRQREYLFYIDGYMVQELGPLNDDIHFMDFIFTRLLSDSFNVVPVISNSTNVDYNQIVKNIVHKVNKGVCLRLLLKPGIDPDSIIKELLNFLELEPDKVDLIIDLQSIEGYDLQELNFYSKNVINSLSYLKKWRSLVLAGSVFPINLSAISPDQIYMLPRIEWQNWESLVLIANLDRIPSYSDYGISHPSYLLYDDLFINMSASIRYTGDNYFYIYRGRGTRQFGFEQFFDLSEMLISREEFCGSKHCSGDNFIFNCGTEKNNTGNPETWRFVGTNHHLTKVTDQLRQFFLDLRH